MLGIISRRTIIWFLLLVASWGFLAYRAWVEEKPCRDWQKEVHQPATVQPELQQHDGEMSFVADPCTLWSPTPVIDKLAALAGLISVVGFATSLIKDIFLWIRLRRSARDPNAM